MAQDFSQENMDRWNVEQNKSLPQKISEGVTGHYGFDTSTLPSIPKVPDIYGPSSEQNQFTRPNPAFVTSNRMTQNTLPATARQSGAQLQPTGQPNAQQPDSNPNTTHNLFDRIPKGEMARFWALHGHEMAGAGNDLNKINPIMDRYLERNSFAAVNKKPNTKRILPQGPTQGPTSSSAPGPAQTAGRSNVDTLNGTQQGTAAFQSDPSQKVSYSNAPGFEGAPFTESGYIGAHRVMPGFQYPNTPQGHIQNVIDMAHNELGAMNFATPEDKVKVFKEILEKALATGGGLGEKEISGKSELARQGLANQGALAHQALTNAGNLDYQKLVNSGRLDVAKLTLPVKQTGMESKLINTNKENFLRHQDSLFKEVTKDKPYGSDEYNQAVRGYNTNYYTAQGVPDELAALPTGKSAFIAWMKERMPKGQSVDQKTLKAWGELYDKRQRQRQAFVDKHWEGSYGPPPAPQGAQSNFLPANTEE